MKAAAEKNATGDAEKNASPSPSPLSFTGRTVASGIWGKWCEGSTAALRRWEKAARAKGMYNASFCPVYVTPDLQKSPQSSQATAPASSREATWAARAPRLNRRAWHRCTGSSSQGDGTAGSCAESARAGQIYPRNPGPSSIRQLLLLRRAMPLLLPPSPPPAPRAPGVTGARLFSSLPPPPLQSRRLETLLLLQFSASALLGWRLWIFPSAVN
uniref:Uncharacterized protein n=1 Tax=Leersia perrieri TaxID=77586 RepID=A0A0D9VYW2_9ORYZ